MSAPSTSRVVCAALALAGVISVTLGAAQRPGGVPPNSYTLAEEAALGREAAAFIRDRFPLVADRRVDAYLHALHARLLGALPKDQRHSGFAEAIAVLNDSDVVSVAVPGGPLVMSRGMIDIAPDEASLAGLMAHEWSHIVLRHGTMQARLGERYQLGDITGRSIAAAAGEQAVGITDRGAHFAVTSYFLMYTPEHEQEADRLAGDMMRRAGYDPGAITAMFHAVRTDGAARAGGWWAMRHPSTHRDATAPAAHAPGRRTGGTLSHELASIQARLRALSEERPSAPEDRRLVPRGTVGYSVAPPGGESRSVTAGDVLQLRVPANWDRMPTGNTVIFAPAGAYLRAADGATAVTHGIQIGVARSLTGTLHGDAHMLLAAFGRKNRSITWTAAFRDVRVGGRPGVTTTVSNVSPVTGEFETVLVSVAHLPDDSLLYVVGVAPQYDAGVYTNAFTRVLDSIQILD